MCLRRPGWARLRPGGIHMVRGVFFSFFILFSTSSTLFAARRRHLSCSPLNLTLSLSSLSFQVLPLQKIRPDLRRLRLVLRECLLPQVPRQLERVHQGTVQRKAESASDAGVRAPEGRKARRSPGTGSQRGEAGGRSLGGGGQRGGEADRGGPPGERDGVREAGGAFFLFFTPPPPSLYGF